MTELQEKELILMSVERGMTKGQRDASKALIQEIRGLILELGQSNFLVYDKIIRGQKIDVINKQISVLNNKLKNKAYVSNAPREIVQNDKNLVKELTIEDGKLRSIVSSIN